MPTIQISDRTKQLIDRLVAERRTADEASCVDEAIALYAEETEAYEDDTAYVIEQAKRGIADIEACRFTTISTPEEADAFWSGMSARVDKRIADMEAARKPDAQSAGRYVSAKTK